MQEDQTQSDTMPSSALIW